MQAPLISKLTVDINSFPSMQPLRGLSHSWPFAITNNYSSIHAICLHRFEVQEGKESPFKEIDFSSFELLSYVRNTLVQFQLIHRLQAAPLQLFIMAHYASLSIVLNLEAGVPTPRVNNRMRIQKSTQREGLD